MRLITVLAWSSAIDFAQREGERLSGLCDLKNNPFYATQSDLFGPCWQEVENPISVLILRRHRRPSRLTDQSEVNTL